MSCFTRNRLCGIRDAEKEQRILDNVSQIIESRPAGRDFGYAGHDPVEHANVRNINQSLCGCAVFVIQKNHLSVIMRLFKPMYNQRKDDFNGQ